MHIGNYIKFLLDFSQAGSGNSRRNASWEKNGPQTTALAVFYTENVLNNNKRPSLLDLS